MINCRAIVDYHSSCFCISLGDVTVKCFNALQVVDAYALIGDVSGLAEKIQSFFMQEVLSETHSVLKNLLQGVCCLM